MVVRKMIFAPDNGTSQSSSIKSIREGLPQILAVSVKNVLIISFGMTLGFPTILIPGLSGSDPNESFSLSEEAISWIGSINLICVPFGCVISGAVTQPMGRRRSMQLVNIPLIAAWLIFRYSNAVWQIYLALCLTGLTGGLLEAPVITYVAEITKPNLRGILSSTSSLSIIAGVLIQFLMGTFLPWRMVALLSCIFPVIAFVLLFFIPESPHWLISKNRLLDARKSIAWLRGWTDLEHIEPEFKELYAYINKSKNIDGNIPDVTEANQTKRINSKPYLETVRLFLRKNFLWPYTLVSFTFFLGQFSGMTTLQTFAVQIFASLHVPIDKYYATVFLGVAEVLGCILCVFLVHLLGKRKLNFISVIGCGICFAVVATYAYSTDVKYIINNNNRPNMTRLNHSNVNHSYSWIPLTFLIASAFISHAGLRVLPWILTGEVYSNETRATASGLSGGMGYVFSFLANKTFLTMVNNLTLYGTFWLNSVVCFIGTALLYFFLPETEGKSLHEISEHFNGGESIGNNVKKKTVLRNKPELENVNTAFDLNETENRLNQQMDSHL